MLLMGDRQTFSQSPCSSTNPYTFSGIPVAMIPMGAPSMNISREPLNSGTRMIPTLVPICVRERGIGRERERERMQWNSLEHKAIDADIPILLWGCICERTGPLLRWQRWIPTSSSKSCCPFASWSVENSPHRYLTDCVHVWEYVSDTVLSCTL